MTPETKCCSQHPTKGGWITCSWHVILGKKMADCAWSNQSFMDLHDKIHQWLSCYSRAIQQVLGLCKKVFWGMKPGDVRIDPALCNRHAHDIQMQQQGTFAPWSDKLLFSFLIDNHGRTPLRHCQHYFLPSKPVRLLAMHGRVAMVGRHDATVCHPCLARYWNHQQHRHTPKTHAPVPWISSEESDISRVIKRSIDPSNAYVDQSTMHRSTSTR